VKTLSKLSKINLLWLACNGLLLIVAILGIPNHDEHHRSPHHPLIVDKNSSRPYQSFPRESAVLRQVEASHPYLSREEALSLMCRDELGSTLGSAGAWAQQVLNEKTIQILTKEIGPTLLREVHKAEINRFQIVKQTDDEYVSVMGSSSSEDVLISEVLSKHHGRISDSDLEVIRHLLKFSSVFDHWRSGYSFSFDDENVYIGNHSQSPNKNDSRVISMRKGLTTSGRFTHLFGSESRARLSSLNAN
jgi:hypothetical protein